MEQKIICLHDGSWASNCYLLIDEDAKAAAVVDPSADAGKITAKLEQKQLKLCAILLTHGHFDHILSLNELREATHAPVYVGEGDAECLTDPSKSLFSRFNGSNDTFAEAEHTLTDGDIIKIGGIEVRVMATPGHTKGSVCYIVENAALRVIFSGDTLFEDDIGRTDLPGGSYGELMKSLAKLSAIEGEYKIYSGHGNPSTLPAEKSHNIYMKQRI